MPDISSDRSQSIDQLLRYNDYPPYRIAILLKCGAVKLIQQGKISIVNTPDTQVENGDIIRISDPISTKCQIALDNIPATEFRDYVFISGSTPYEERAKKIFDLRPLTIRIKDPNVYNVAGFFRALRNNKAIINPIRNLLIVSHANDEGNLLVPLNIISAEIIEYEDLEKASQSKSIGITDQTIMPRPKDNSGAPVPARLDIKGCRIGSALPFLRLLKNALGGRILVTAPKHLETLSESADPHPGGVEYMLYNFQINRPKKFKDRSEAIREFNAHGFQRVDGKKVPPEDWQEWIPKGKNPNENQGMVARVVSPINNKTISIAAYLKYRERALFNKDSSIDLKEDPRTESGRKKAVRDSLVKEYAYYRDDHLFPMYVRLGYASMDAFMNGWNWKFRWQSSKKLLFFRPIRYEYKVRQPIIEPTTRRLFLNFYPIRPIDKPIIQLVEADNRFFATV